MRRDVMLTILSFNAVTALVGGVALVFGLVDLPEGWLRNSFFDSYVVPGLILAVVVGGSSLLAFIAYLYHYGKAPLLGLLSGLIMIGWVLSQIIVIQQSAWLQLLYLATGALVSVMAYTDSKEAFIWHHWV